MAAGVGATFDSYGPNSGIDINSSSGDVTLNTLQQPTNTNASGVANSLFLKVGHNASTNPRGAGADAPPTRGDGGGESDDIGPATVEVSALTGDITLDNTLLLFPSSSGTLDLLAGGSISTVTPFAATATAGNSGTSGEFVSNITMLDATAISSTTLFNILGTPTRAALSQALHLDDNVPAIIYAGDNITGVFDLIKPAEMEAGNDIVNTTFIGQNNNSTDITSVIAGRDILAEELLINGGIADHSSTFAVYGPGTFLIDAGRNLGPFFSGGVGTISPPTCPSSLLAKSAVFTLSATAAISARPNPIFRSKARRFMRFSARAPASTIRRRSRISSIPRTRPTIRASTS